MYLTKLEPRGRSKWRNGYSFILDYNRRNSYLKVNNNSKDLFSTRKLELNEGKPVEITVHIDNCIWKSTGTGGFVSGAMYGFINIEQSTTFLGRIYDGYTPFIRNNNIDFSFYLHPDQIANSLRPEHGSSFNVKIYAYDEKQDHSNAYEYVEGNVSLPLYFTKNWRIPKLDVPTPVSGIKNTPFNLEFTATNRNNSETSGKSLTTEIIIDDNNIIYSNANTVSGQKITQLIDTTSLTPGNHMLKVRSYHPGFPEETAQYPFQKTNTAPNISGETDTDLGTITKEPSYSYTVSDSDNDSVTVTEKLDGKTLRSGINLGGGNTPMMNG